MVKYQRSELKKTQDKLDLLRNKLTASMPELPQAPDIVIIKEGDVRKENSPLAKPTRPRPKSLKPIPPSNHIIKEGNDEDE